MVLSLFYIPVLSRVRVCVRFEIHLCMLPPPSCSLPQDCVRSRLSLPLALSLEANFLSTLIFDRDVWEALGATSLRKTHAAFIIVASPSIVPIIILVAGFLFHYMLLPQARSIMGGIRNIENAALSLLYNDEVSCLPLDAKAWISYMSSTCTASASF